MLKFIKYHMSSIAGIEIYPLISFLIFFLFFIGVTIWVFKTDKGFFAKMENLPLDNNNDFNTESKSI
jgi:cytochrome c oxidase cbb3-type subunit IV